MKCYVCNGTGKRFVPTNKNAITGNGYTADCLICNGTGKLALTNEKWRRTCSAEEFTEWISNLAYACMRCGMSNGEAYCHTGYCIQDKEDAEKWLKEIHDGE